MSAALTANQRTWVSALRSGEYRQTEGALKRGTGGMTYHCCLGVAVDLCPQVQWDPDNPTRVVVPERACRGHHGLPPKPVFDWLDTKFVPHMSGEDGVGTIQLDIPSDWPFDKGYLRTKPDLYHYNDMGFTFSQIADLIEFFGLRPVSTVETK